MRKTCGNCLHPDGGACNSMGEVVQGGYCGDWSPCPIKIISGGQTGADRGALEAAKALGIRTGGMAPKGYRTEKGPDLSLKDFGLVESPFKSYPARTEHNVRFSDMTIIFGRTNSVGSRMTMKFCDRHNIPFICNPEVANIKYYIQNGYRIFNIAGNRESKNPGIQSRVYNIIYEAFKDKDNLI